MNSGHNLLYETLFRTILWVGLFILISTLLIFSFIRVIEVYHSVQTATMPPEENINYGYASHPFLTFFHILPGIVLIVLGPLQFIKPLRNRFINVHRWIGRVYVVFGLVVGITAIIMGFVIRFGGIAETSAVTVFGAYFIYALVVAYRYIRKKQYQLHREWMIRAFSMGLAVGTMRPVIGFMLSFTSIPFNVFFGYIFWFAFIVHFIVAEIWIHFSRKKVVKANR